VKTEPRPSSTVLLLRQGADLPEVLMVHRNAATAFGDVFAFPGGVIDGYDSQVHAYCAESAVAELKPCAEGGDSLNFYSAAIRELFEEAGVLLARNRDGSWPGGAAGDRQSLEQMRRELNDGSLAWPDLLGTEQFQLAVDSLHYFAHWITPQSEPKRFSTRFFAAVLPPGQLASHDGSEITDSRWMSVPDVLRQNRSGDMKLIFPTYVTLKGIGQFSTAAEVLDWARHQSELGVNAINPAIIEKSGKPKVVLPGDPDYPERDEH
jgi:8-oxo-dGTP pyrophosphatase MutT (NUDIX family)